MRLYIYMNDKLISTDTKI